MLDFGLPSSVLLSRDLTPLVRFAIAGGLCLVACSFLYLLARSHSRRLMRIPVRIHVAGTRGKSSTVRMIAAGFRGAGFTVVAKTTGTQPSLILPDGSERRIRRWGAPAIREQRDFIAAASRLHANVIVAEAMAIQPEYLNALERFYIRATDLVVTNVRPDHREQLGDDPAAMANAIATCIPRNGRVFVSAEAAVPPITHHARRADVQVTVSATGGADNDPQATNIELAVAVCRQHGIAVDAASAVLRAAAPDIGLFRLTDWPDTDGRIRFANAFSCNDAESFARLWKFHQPATATPAFFLCPRTDRPLRTREFLAEMALLAPAATLFIAGRNFMLPRMARASGFSPARIHRVPRHPAADTLREIAAKLSGPTILWGVGNYKGAGERLTGLLAGIR